MNSPDASLTTGSFASLGYTHSEGFNLQNNLTFTESQSHLNEYGLHLASSGLSQSTIRNYMWDVQQFIKWIGNLFIVPSNMGADIPALYSKYLLEPDHLIRPNSIGRYSSSTIRRKLHSLRRFFDYLVGECVLHKNPFREFIVQIPQRTSSTRKHTILSVKTIRQLIATCDISKPIGIRDRALLVCIMGIGLRVGEIRLLNAVDVNLINRSLKVTERNSKARTVPLLDDIASSLELWLVVRSLHSNSSDSLFISLHHSTGRGESGMRLTKRGIRKIVNRRLKLVGAKKPGVSCEVLRRSAIIHLLSNDGALDGIRSMFGLKPKTLRAYQGYVTDIYP